jgi:hypothetical protein
MGQDNEIIVSLERVSKHYGPTTLKDFRALGCAVVYALREVDLAIKCGERVAVM